MVLASLCLPVAGCLGEESSDGLPQGATPSLEGPLQLPLAFATAWDGDLVFLATLIAEEPTTCALSLGYHSAGLVEGWELAFLELRGPDVAPGWMIVSNSVQEVKVHAAGNSVGGLQPLQAGWLDSTWSLEDVASPVTIVTAVRGLDPQDGTNLKVKLDCKGPAQVTSLEAGSDVVRWDAASNGGGAGARAGAVFVEAGGAALDRVVMSTTKPHGLAFVQEMYGQVGIVRLSTPAGAQDLVLRPHVNDEPLWVVVRGGPGQYSASYEEVDVLAGGHWGLFAGLAPVKDLEGLLGQSGHGHGCEAICYA